MKAAMFRQARVGEAGRGAETGVKWDAVARMRHMTRNGHPGGRASLSESAGNGGEANSRGCRAASFSPSGRMLQRCGTDRGAAGADNYALEVGINDLNNSQDSPNTTAMAARA